MPSSTHFFLNASGSLPPLIGPPGILFLPHLHWPPAVSPRSAGGLAWPRGEVAANLRLAGELHELSNTAKEWTHAFQSSSVLPARHGGKCHQLMPSWLNETHSLLPCV